MREILFRGKRLDNGEWVEGWYQPETTIKHWDGRQETIGFTITYKVEEGFLEDTLVDQSTVGQYTGLKDKNGKRIFEGDICRNTRTGEIVSVKWHGTMAGYVWNKMRADGFLFDFGELFRACDKYEVIGNIHDNPEMLKGGEV